jgi:phosphate transport system permease protein
LASREKSKVRQTRAFTSANHPVRRIRRFKERAIETILFLCAASSVVVTLGIVWILVSESLPFFDHVSLTEFLTGTEWTPMFADAKFGILPLVSGTLMVTGIALLFAIPLGTIIATFLSEYVSPTKKEIIKPILELLAAVPTVVYGYFALFFVTPFYQKIFPEISGFNVLSAGTVIGIMIIPYVSSLTEDAMRSVPNYLREGSYALGSSRLQTSFRVVYPAALSGITSAYILGISRALGETMVVAIAAGMQPQISFNPLQPSETITAFIVQVSLGDLPHGSVGYQSIYVAGLTLLVMTLMFNIFGFWLRKRYREVVAA